MRPPTARVSIHAPPGGRDNKTGELSHWNDGFNPRAPWGARLMPDGLLLLVERVSIHAPPGGRDEETMRSTCPI